MVAMIASHHLKSCVSGKKNELSSTLLLLIAFALLIFLIPAHAQTDNGNHFFNFSDFTLGQFDERNFMPILRFLVATSYVIGIWLLIAGMYSLKRYGQMRTMMMSQVHITGPLMKILAGLILFYLPATATAFIYSLWGTTSVMQWEELGEVKSWAHYFEPIAHMMTLVGYAAFIKGWVLMSRLGKEGGQPGGFGKAFMHIFGGVLSINFVGTINIIQRTFT